MPKLDLNAIEKRDGAIYPGDLAQIVAGRVSQRLGAAAGLTQFGVNLVSLDPGSQSSIRHWHENQDEFLMITEGTLTLMEDDGETEMGVGDCAAFKAGDPNAHCLINRSGKVARFLVVGTHTPSEVAHYPDIGMQVSLSESGATFTTEDGEPWGDPT